MTPTTWSVQATSERQLGLGQRTVQAVVTIASPAARPSDSADVDVRLRVVTGGTADVRSIVQTTPPHDLPPAESASPSTDAPGTVVVRLGGWAPDERRTYHLAFELRRGRRGEPGDRLRLADVQLLGPDDAVADAAAIVVEWTEEPRPRTARPDDEIPQHLERVALVHDMDVGIAALHEGDRIAALEHLARAHRHATALGARQHLDRLNRLVAIDSVTGEPVRLLDGTADDIVRALTYSTRTGDPPDQPAATEGDADRPDPGWCDTCERPVPERYCESCGEDIRPHLTRPID